MRKQFDRCSYGELTECVRARIEWIREYRRFREDELSHKYPHIRVKIMLSILINENEIRRLLEMRRVLKNSHLKNWNSYILSI